MNMLSLSEGRAMSTLGEEDKVVTTHLLLSMFKLLGLTYYGLKGGRLGLGTEEDVCTPKEVIFMENTKKDFCDEVKTSVDSLL